LADDELQRMDADRAAATQAIINSPAPKRVIVAGPGTGKSFTFRAALAKAIADAGGGRGLALTFIRNLVADLAKDLGDLADVFTFHGYCKHLMHSHDVAGLQSGAYYPPLLELVVEDVQVLGERTMTPDDVNERLHNLDMSDDVIDVALARADYYGAVSHNDVVYRVHRHFEASPETIPSYPLIVVDEFQDFSRLETTFIDLLASRSPVLIAGDDDQALYKKLKYASPEFIRQLATDGSHERFELPFCSRCTEVVVAAVNDVIEKATQAGHLEGRLEKPFRCFLPDKKTASEENPRIVNVDCSTANTEYASQYIAQQIAQIPREDIMRSRENGYPTALVIGPNPFLRRAFDVVQERFPQARMKKSEQPAVDILDGYRRVASNERSRLGWRIVLACCPCDAWQQVLKDALGSDTDIYDRLPSPYRDEHLENARLAGSLMETGTLSDEERQKLCAAAGGRSIEAVRAFLNVADPDDISDEIGEAEAEAAPETLDIVFTSLVGSKGLSAEHVFIIGMNNGHFPRHPDAVTDDEVCSLIVALSRTRTRCHVISFRWFGKDFLSPSLFLNWIGPHLETLTVNKDYDFSD
jgi:ATP-dependent DNA helicase UvrD/PcrA